MGIQLTQAKSLCRIARPKVARGEGAKISPEGKILLLPNCRRGVASLKRMGSFAVCGRRLKKLFEKSSLRNLKNFYRLRGSGVFPKENGGGSRQDRV
ncbi:MAG: hypothetical protein IJY97_03800, partial [Clostridia bacterium]|nr:hypothetical protein [Clostridia bacterium]